MRPVIGPRPTMSVGELALTHRQVPVAERSELCIQSLCIEAAVARQHDVGRAAVAAKPVLGRRRGVRGRRRWCGSGDGLRCASRARLAAWIPSSVSHDDRTSKRSVADGACPIWDGSGMSPITPVIVTSSTLPSVMV